MNKKSYKLFIILCLIMLVFPFAGMTVAPTMETTENKELMEMPKITDDDGFNINYLSDLGEYFQENFAFRQEMVSMNALIYGKSFGSSTTDQVIIGEDDWMYYSGTLDDYLSENVMSERAINNAVHNLGLIQDYVEKRGSRFLLTVVPNKNSLYDENMPYYYKKGMNANNYELLIEKMKEKNIHFVDFKERFESVDEVLYLKQDSHWTNKGAVTAYNEMMSFFVDDYETYDNVPYEVRKEHLGDLTEMLYPLNSELEDNQYYQKEWSWSYVNTVVDNMDEWIETSNPSAQGSVLMYRDSFGESLLPFFAEAFETAYFSRLVPYNMGNIDQYTPDYTIVERVERRIPSFASETPIMSAPTLSIQADIEKETNTTLEMTLEGGYYWIRGTVDETVMDDETEIYVLFTNKSGKSVGYIPFYISREDDSNPRNCGYSMYINKNTIPKDVYDVEVFVENNQEVISVSMQRIDLNMFVD